MLPSMLYFSTTITFALVIPLFASSIEFYIPPALTSYDEAVNQCESYGTNLISIHSTDDFQAAITACKTMVESYSISNDSNDYMRADGCWIGLSANPEFEWSDNTDIDFGFDDGTPNIGRNPWAANKPSETHSNSPTCISLSSKSPAHYEWNDIPCYYLQYPLCSKQLTQTTTEEPHSITPYCDGVLYHDISKEYDINDILFDPAGVCQVVYDTEQNRQLSTMLQCNEHGTDIIYNVFTNTDCSGSIIQSLSYVKDDVPAMYYPVHYTNYSVICSGTPCDYGIVRSYQTENCNVSIGADNKYSDSVIVLNDYWRNVNEKMYMIHTECNDGQSIDGYSFDYFDKKQFETIMDGECNDGSSYGGQTTQYKILCGTAIVTRFNGTTGSDRKGNHTYHSDKSKKLIILLVVGSIVVVFVVICLIAIRIKIRKRINKSVRSANFIQALSDDEVDASDVIIT